MKNSKTQLVELVISDYSRKGNGIGYYQTPQGGQRTLEVPFTMPGDRVRALLLRKRSGVYLCRLQEIIEPALERRAARCIHFSICGGCRWQHFSYAKQLEKKELNIRQCFKDLSPAADSFYTAVPSASEWQYRNKMEFSFSENAAGDKFLGLMMDGGRGKVLNLQECHLVNPWFIKAKDCVAKWWESTTLHAYHASKDRGSLRTLTLREGFRTGDRMAMLTVSGNPDFALNKVQLEGFVKSLLEAIQPEQPSSQLSIFLRIQQIAKGMSTNFYEMHLHGADHIREVLHIKKSPNAAPDILTFKISPTAFFQPNSAQAERLYSLVLQHAGITPDSVVYDLYCGTGTMGICIAKYAKQVYSVELSSESALDAKTNAILNGHRNLTVICGAVRHVLNQRGQENALPEPDVIIVDPPRPGLDPQALSNLLELKAPKIIYVSCNPTTQAQNLAELVKNGYRLKIVQPVDQFPQTIHVENIAILELA